MFSESSEDFMMHSAVGIHSISHDGTILYANQYELEMLGYTEKEYVGHNAMDFQLDKMTIETVMQGLLDLKDFKNYPARVQGKSSIKYVLYNSNVHHKDGKFIHTRCFGAEIDHETYQLFKSSFDGKYIDR